MTIDELAKEHTLNHYLDVAGQAREDRRTTERRQPPHAERFTQTLDALADVVAGRVGLDGADSWSIIRDALQQAYGVGVVTGIEAS